MAEENKNGSEYPKSPFAKYSGTLKLGDTIVDCYVLDTGERVISLRATVTAITDKEGGGLEGYIGVEPLKPYINSKLVLEQIIEFDIPGVRNLPRAKGITAENFLEICHAYVKALSENALKTERQKGIAIKCSVLLASCSKVGLIALIDEATGYQYERPADALQVKLQLFISEEMRSWEKTFPDELWEEFGRLTDWKRPLHSRPKYWGILVMDLIYEALDPDVAEHLRTHKPPPRHGLNYHQWMTKDFGLKALLTHIHQGIGIAKTCDTIHELKEKVSHYYKGGAIQQKIFKKMKNS